MNDIPPAPGAPRRRGSRAARLAFGTALGLLLAEVLVRAAGLEARWLQDLAYFNSVDPEVHQWSEDLDLVFELKPGAAHEYGLPDGPREDEHSWWTTPRVVGINDLGHRGAARTETKAEGTYRIMALGGSNTYGAAVSDHETWPAALEQALARRTERPVEVWNLGVSAYVTRQKLGMARRALRRYDPDLLVFQMSNTGPRNVLLQDEQKTLEAFRDDPRLYRESLLHVPERGSPSGVWFDASALVRVVVLARNRRERAAEGGAFGDPVLELDERSERLAALELAEFVATDAGSVPVVILYAADAPGPEWLDAAGLPVLDLAMQRDRPDTPEGRHLHPGAGVYRWYAERIADYLLASGCLEGRCAPRSWWHDVVLDGFPGPFTDEDRRY